MRRIIISVAAIAIAITALNSSAYGQRNPNIATLPTLGESVQYPKRKLQFVRHTFRVNIPEGSNAISQLQVSIPPGLSVGNDIRVHDGSGTNFMANTSVNGNTVTIDFPKPVTGVTELEIDMNKVKISGASNVFDYRVIAKLVGIEPELNLGVAEIHTSR